MTTNNDPTDPGASDFVLTGQATAGVEAGTPDPNDSPAVSPAPPLIPEPHMQPSISQRIDAIIAAIQGRDADHAALVAERNDLKAQLADATTELAKLEAAAGITPATP
jgi:hypothetical protein